MFRAFATFGAGIGAAGSPQGKVCHLFIMYMAAMSSTLHLFCWHSAFASTLGAVPAVSCLRTCWHPSGGLPPLRCVNCCLWCPLQAVEMDGPRFAKLCRETGVQVCDCQPALLLFV